MSENVNPISQVELQDELVAQTQEAKQQTSEVTNAETAMPKPEAQAPEPETAPAPAKEAEAPAAEDEATIEPTAEATPAPETPAPEKRSYAAKSDVIDRLRELAQGNEVAERTELETLKQTYYKLRHEEVAADRAAFIEAGGNADEYMPKPDTEEDTFKAEMQLLKERRAKHYENQEKEKAENLERKQNILLAIKALVAAPEETGKSYDKFKQLQADWKETGSVPAEHTTELWRNYQLYCEQFYDLLKLNNEFREYDFKKNLDIKERICEAAEKLVNEPDPVSAFHQLQKLHQEFRETGPVAKDLREPVWTRFKAASTIVNKRHQAHFEELKSREEENLVKKTELCEKIEGFHLDELRTYADWDKVTQDIIAIQAEWKQIGFTPKKMNAKIFERFRAACDNFFRLKSEHFKQIKPILADNYAKKVELCERAEALKESTEWSKTAAQLVKLQKEWKEIGPVQKKYSEAVWKRFIGACNAFFDARNKANSEQRTQENDNLAKKRGIIEKLKAITSETEGDARKLVRDLMSEWGEVGHIPFKQKDKVYAAYREQVDRLFTELDMHGVRSRVENFKNKIKNAGSNALDRERDHLFRAYEQKKSEILTYENNLGFLSAKSKKGNSLLDDMRRKVERLKEELETIRQKIASVDEKKNASAAPEAAPAEAPQAGPATTEAEGSAAE